MILNTVQFFKPLASWIVLDKEQRNLIIETFIFNHDYYLVIVFKINDKMFCLNLTVKKFLIPGRDRKGGVWTNEEKQIVRFMALC